MSQHEPAITLRPALADAEAFLFDLRKATITEHLARVGEPADDAGHRARLLHRYDAARVICIDGTPTGLLKAPSHRDRLASRSITGRARSAVAPYRRTRTPRTVAPPPPMLRPSR
jgi:hypothetical protein